MIVGIFSSKRKVVEENQARARKKAPSSAAIMLTPLYTQFNSIFSRGDEKPRALKAPLQNIQTVLEFFWQFKDCPLVFVHFRQSFQPMPTNKFLSVRLYVQ